MNEDCDETEGVDSEVAMDAGESRDSTAWKYVGGLGLGCSVPMLLIAVTTADKPETPESEPGQILKFALPIAIISLCLCFVDQIRAWVRTNQHDLPTR